MRDSYQKIASEAYKNIFDKQVVNKFFAAFEQRDSVTPEERIKYLQLKYYHGADKKSVYLSEIAELYLRMGMKQMAYLCWVESLRLDPSRMDVACRVQEFPEGLKIRFPEKLQPDKVMVSVVMTTYNRGDIIRESIQSVLDQDFQDFELWLINDGGDTAVETILEELDSPKIRYLRKEHNTGLPSARNEALIRAEGKYIAYLDDDDVYLPNHLSVLLERLSATGAKVAYANTRAIQGRYENGKFIPGKCLFVWDEDFDKDTLVQRIYIGTCAIMHEKAILADTGFFIEDLSCGQDWEFWLRFALKYRFEHLRQFTSEYRIREDNRTVANRISGYFFGAMVTKFYAFHKGEVALLKNRLSSGATGEARRSYEAIRGRYRGWFRTADLCDDLMETTLKFGDTVFCQELMKDFSRIAPRRCLSCVFRLKKISLLQYIFSQLCGRIALGIGLRIKGTMEVLWKN